MRHSYNNREWYREQGVIQSENKGDSSITDGLTYAVAIFEATVRSLSSFVLFRSNACCLQSSRLLQLWCSGSRC